MNNNIIDVHHHILPDDYLESLKQNGINKSFGVSFPRWSIEKALSLMDETGIQTAITSISAPGIYFGKTSLSINLSRTVNEFGAQLVNEYPQRFGVFASLPLPDLKASLKELEYSLDVLKLDGIVLLTHYDNYYLGDSYYKDIYYELNKREAVVFIHPDIPKGAEATNIKVPAALFEVVHDTTRAVANLVYTGVIKKYPKIKFILSHAGGTVPYLAFRLSLPEYYFMGKIVKYFQFPEGVISYLQTFYYDTALAASPYNFKSLRELVDDSHILFGSDNPFANAVVVKNTVEGIESYNDFSASSRNMIYHENASKLFPRLNQQKI
jgi:6-methylsalicylate decarboxylase